MAEDAAPPGGGAAPSGLSARERALLEAQLRRGRLPLILSLAGAAAGLGLGGWWLAAGRLDAPRVVIALLLLLGAKNNLRIWRLGRVMAKLAAGAQGGARAGAVSEESARLLAHMAGLKAEAALGGGAKSGGWGLGTWLKLGFLAASACAMAFSAWKLKELREVLSPALSSGQAPSPEALEKLAAQDPTGNLKRLTDASQRQLGRLDLANDLEAAGEASPQSPGSEPSPGPGAPRPGRAASAPAEAPAMSSMRDTRSSAPSAGPSGLIKDAAGKTVGIRIVGKKPSSAKAAAARAAGAYDSLKARAGLSDPEVQRRLAYAGLVGGALFAFAAVFIARRRFLG